MSFERFKKPLILLCINFSFIFLPAYAQTVGEAPAGGAAAGIEALLQQIVINTREILDRVDNLPAYMRKTLNFTLKWVSDNSPTTAEAQQNFTELANEYNKVNAAQTDAENQKMVLDEFFGVYGNTEQDREPQRAELASKYGAINDLVFQSLYGIMYAPEARKGIDIKKIQKNYINNTAGSMLKHPVPYEKGMDWIGGPGNIKKYSSYYSTIMAVQTYNRYIMNELYEDAKNNHQISKLQKTLIDQASKGDWFVEVASQKLGIVLRQILLYNSQSFVVLVRMLETEKQILRAESMNTTLMILLNQLNESELIRKATTKPLPGG